MSLSPLNGQWPKTCSPECKTARIKKYRQERYAADREGAKRKAREWVIANREWVAERERRRREANRDSIRVAKRAYVAANAERESVRKKAWHKANRERILAEWKAKQTPESRAEAARRAREWARLNPERRVHGHRQWYLSNPDRAAATNLRRRARRRSVPADTVSLEELLQEQQGYCYLCTARINLDLQYPDPMSASIDHVVPLARGGTGLRDNLRAVHLICNRQKGIKLLGELAGYPCGSRSG